MKYNPDDANPQLLPEQWYDAVIVNAEEKVSKKGNDMMVVTYEIYDNNLNPHIDDYFVTGIKGAMSRMKKMAHAIGLGQQFFTGSMLPADVMGKNLKILVKVQKSENPRYEDKNVAAAYETADFVPPTEGAPVDAATPDDNSIPF